MRAPFSVASATMLILSLAACGGGSSGGSAGFSLQAPGGSATGATGNTQAPQTTPEVAADARNGTYQVFSGAGTEFKFKVDFDLKQYALLDSAGALIRSGTLMTDPETAGTYVMVDAVTKLATSNNARFRVSADTLVGVAPLPLPFANTTNISESLPFVATRSLVTDKTQLDGLYNRLDLTLTAGSGNSLPQLSSRLHEVKISGQGTGLDQCNETNTLSNLANCTGTGKTLVHYTAAATADAQGHWTFTNDSDASDKLVFAVARIGGENVLLESDADARMPANRVFRVGLPSGASWPTSTAYGGSEMGDWSKYSIGPTSIDVTSKALDGSSSSESYPLSVPSTTEPQGWKKASFTVGQTTGVAFAMQGKGLYVLMGSPSIRNGYLHVGLTH